MNKLSNRTEGRKIVRSIIEPSIKIEGEPKWYKENNPVAKITRVKDSKDYREAISLSCTVFEHLGKKVLKWHSKQTGTRIPREKLKRLEIILSELYSCGLIDQNIHDRMNGVKNKITGIRNVRNNHEHGDRTFNYSSDQAMEDKVAANTALKCVKNLSTKYGFLW